MKTEPEATLMRPAAFCGACAKAGAAANTSARAPAQIRHVTTNPPLNHDSLLRGRGPENRRRIRVLQKCQRLPLNELDLGARRPFEVREIHHRPARKFQRTGLRGELYPLGLQLGRLR